MSRGIMGGPRCPKCGNIMTPRNGGTTVKCPKCEPKTTSIVLSLALLALSGCASTPTKVPLEPVTVTETEYVIKIPPAQMMTLPPAVAPVNVDTAKQSDIAQWLLAKEGYTRSLENQLKAIAQFFVDQQNQLNSAAKAQNVQQQDAAAAANAANAAAANQKKVDLNAQPSK